MTGSYACQNIENKVSPFGSLNMSYHDHDLIPYLCLTTILYDTYSHHLIFSEWLKVQVPRAKMLNDFLWEEFCLEWCILCKFICHEASHVLFVLLLVIVQKWLPNWLLSVQPSLRIFNLTTVTLGSFSLIVRKGEKSVHSIFPHWFGKWSRQCALREIKYMLTMNADITVVLDGIAIVVYVV